MYGLENVRTRERSPCKTFEIVQRFGSERIEAIDSDDEIIDFLLGQ